MTTAGEHVGGQGGGPYNEAASDASGPVLSDDNLQRWRLLSLTAIMVAVIVLAAGVSLAMLYRAELDSQSELLHELALSEARLINVVMSAQSVELGANMDKATSLGALADGLSQRLPKAGFGKSGEFILARRHGDQIILSRRGDPFSPGPTLTIPMQSDLAVPARLGLRGHSGIVRVLDYAGVKVLAAHEPVPGYDLAAVAKIDLFEVQGPFLIAAMVISGGILDFLILVIGGWHYISLTIAQREHTTRKLRRSQSRLSRAQKIAHLGGWQYNFRTEEFSATDETYRLFGLARPEVNDAFRAPQEFIHPEDREATDQARVNALKNSHDYEIDYRIVRPNGGLSHIREKDEFEFDAHGTRFRLAGTVHDVTEQRRIEERLRQQALNFDQVHEAVVSTDTEGNILSWNKGAERQSGFSAEEMIGNSIDLCIAPKDKERFWRELAPLAYEHGSTEFEVWLCHRDGSIYRGHSSVAVLRDGQGKIIGAVSCNLDVTTKYRTEQDLIKAKLQAETANRSKSEFLANMSHELRTPLNAILRFSQIMMAGMLVKEDLERAHEYATDIFDSGTHLLAVINDLLDLAKIESGHMDLEEGEVDVGEIIAVSLRQVNGRAKVAGLTLIDAVPPGLPPLWADERKLKQVVLKLLSNAVKFTPRGGEIRV